VNRVACLVTVAALAATVLIGCSQGSSSQSSTSTSSSLSTTTSTTMSKVYEPYENARAAVDPQGTVREATTTTPDGRIRRYRTYVPASLVPGAKVPLLVALHGGLGWGEQFETNSGFDGLAESNQFIVVYPDGTNAQAGSQKLLTWNGGMCCGAAAAQNVDDVGFVAQVIEELSMSLPIDQRRVSATGHSNGAILAYRLACELSDRISSIGVQAGVLGVPCAPAQPVSVFHLHGLADANIPIDGGKGAGVSGVVFPSPREAPNAFAVTNRCTQGPVDQRNPENPDVVARTWAGCSDSRAVQFVTVAGASHAWMGHSGVNAASTSLVGTPYQGLDASRAIWSFLAVQPPR
jgi:polyhydroxybutyrate depolymerase